VPKGIPAGTYSGLLRVDDDVLEEAVLHVSVVG
jgi:hypothetical protein